MKPAKRMLGDKAYDSAELRDELDERGTKPVIPNRSNRKQPFQLQQAPLQASLAHRERVQQIEGLQAHRNPLRQAGAKLPGLCLPRRRAGMVDLMSCDPSTGHAAFDPCPARPRNADRALLTAAHRAVSAFPSHLIGTHPEKAR